MKKFDSQKRIKTVPLLCWDIYMDHLDKMLGRSDNNKKRLDPFVKESK